MSHLIQVNHIELVGPVKVEVELPTGLTVSRVVMVEDSMELSWDVGKKKKRQKIRIKLKKVER